MKEFKTAIFIGVALMLYSASAAAQLSNQGMLDQVVTEFATRASSWKTVVMAAATRLYWTLVVISMVWTFGMMALRKADIGDFFAEFTRFTIFTGFFWWLLSNGPDFASSIIQSLQQLGEQASNVSSVTPSGIVDIGFMIFKQSLVNTSIWSPIDSFIGFCLSLGILLLLATVAVNMLLLFVSSWILMYAGVFFLGFGGARWTSDMAINYYKTVLGVAVQIFAMVLLVGIGVDLLSSFYAKMDKGTLNFEELGVMLVFCFALLLLINKIPSLLSGVITGASIGHAGIGNFGAGAAVGAASMATAAATTGGAMIASGAANAAGGAQAIMAAFSKANENVAAGSDVLTSMLGSGGSGDVGSGEASGSGSTPFAEAAGFSGGSGATTANDKNPSGDDQNAIASEGGETASSAGGDSCEGSTGGEEGQGGSTSASEAVASGSGAIVAEGATAGDAGTGESGGGDQAAKQGFFASAAAAAGRVASSAAKMGATAGKIAADAGANLAMGTAEVAKAKAASIKESAMDRISDTTGGKIAAAIKGLGSSSAAEAAPAFDGNSLGGEGAGDTTAAADTATPQDHLSNQAEVSGEPSETEPEVAEFVNKTKGAES